MAITNLTAHKLKDVKGLQAVRKPFPRIEVRADSLVEAEAKLRKKAEKETNNKANWLIEIRYYETTNGKFLMSGTPVKLEAE